MPQVDCGRFPVKRVAGERVDVAARIFRDGHDVLGAAVRYRPAGTSRWQEAPLAALGNDHWSGSFPVDRPGSWSFRIEAWTDRIASFQDELRRKVEGGQEDVSSELAEGAALLGRATVTVEEALAAPAGDRSGTASSEVYEVDVDRVLARFGSWYELFPRSWGGFEGVRKLLPDFAELGFDVLYLPPIHPIGRTNRKGRNNTLTAGPKDPGSPWAIGSSEGGHDAVHPDLGSLKEFERLVADAKKLGIEIAIDFAIQCSPDHPWLKEHPEWFNRRPDGTLKYAENPPKKYQDIYNVNFESEDWKGLWAALRDVVLTWVERGVTVFRVDNPHTKPVPFWEWLIDEVRRDHPEVIFLAEAFTRPAMMTTLAKSGFAQSYTYFTWKNTRWELLEFMGQLLDWSEIYRPNVFANTPDILHEYLQRGGPPAFEARLVLAATLSPAYGIYSGFESFENVPRARRQRGVPRLGEVRGEEAAPRRAAAAAHRDAQQSATGERCAAAPRQRDVPRDRERAAVRLSEARGRQRRDRRRQPRPDGGAAWRVHPPGRDRPPARVPRRRPPRRRRVDVAHRPQLRRAAAREEPRA